MAGPGKHAIIILSCSVRLVSVSESKGRIRLPIIMIREAQESTSLDEYWRGVS